jgi:uncharacterized protein
MGRLKDGDHSLVRMGRVIDGAHILSPQTAAALRKKLIAHEEATQQQIVVVTALSLQGYDISDFGYQLGRRWGIGQKGKSNGALFIVAPADGKAWIEVGYDLKGVLTDAAVSQIIQKVILPAFRAGQMERGVVEGVNATLTAAEGVIWPVPVVLAIIFLRFYLMPRNRT